MSATYQGGLSPVAEILFAALWAAIPHYEREDDVPAEVFAYVEWVYAQPSQMWDALTAPVAEDRSCEAELGKTEERATEALAAAKYAVLVKEYLSKHNGRTT